MRAILHTFKLGLLCFVNLLTAQPYASCVFEGQLGNQLFQAAATIAYALDHNYTAIFPPFSHLINGALNRKYVFHRLQEGSLPLETPILQYHDAGHYTQYTPIPYTPGRNILLSGYFQTARYFAHHADTIRKLFAPSNSLTKKIFKKYGRLLHQGPTIAIHVRTFIPDGRDPAIVGIGGGKWDYFLKALEHLPRDCSILLFSDAPKWTRDNFPSLPHRQVHFIEGNPHYFDFYLMAFCTHQIVSPESTFSWWAAWLNANPGKVIVAPATWAGKFDNETIPPEWIKVEL
jgi:hypothetical protein